MKIPPLVIKEPQDLKDLFKAIVVPFTLLMSALRNVSFADNFRTYTWEGTIEPLTTKRIPHDLKRVPSGKLVERHKGGLIDDSESDWTIDVAYLRNISSTSNAVVKVKFYV